LRSLVRAHSIIKFWDTKLIKKESDEYVFRNENTFLYKWAFLCEIYGIIHYVTSSYSVNLMVKWKKKKCFDMVNVILQVLACLTLY